MTTYAEILPKFQKFHQVPQNNDCHVATLAIGLAGAAGLVTRAARACAPTDATGRYSKARAAAALLWVAYALAIFCTDARRGAEIVGPATRRTWIFRGDKSRRRRGCHVDIPWGETSRGDAAAAT